MASLNYLNEALRRSGALGAAQNQATATNVNDNLINLRVLRYTITKFNVADFPQEEVVKNFPDNHLFGKKAITLKRLDYETIIALGSNTFKRLKSNFCQQDAEILLLLAFNLRGQDRISYVCTDEIPEDCLGNDDIDYHLLDNTNILVLNAMTFRSNVRAELANAFCFVAASTLRLFTKTANNYNRAFDSIIDGYKSFFSLEFPINNIRIGPNITPLLAYAYTKNDVMKHTLYRIIWSANGCDTHKSIKDFLYDQHIKNTGMHIVRMFADTAKALHLKPHDLIVAMSNPRYNTIFNDLVDLLNNFLGSNDDGLRRMLWAYARIFDQKFFSTLQTKNCIDIVAILANVLRIKDSEGSEGLFNIVHIAKMSEEEKVMAREFAKRLIVSVSR